MYKKISIVVLYIVLTLGLYFLSPLVHWLLGISSTQLRLLILVITLLLIALGAIAFYKLKKGNKHKSLYLFVFALCFFVSQVKEAFYTEGKYWPTVGHDIIVSFEDGYGVQNSVGKSLLSAVHDEVIFIEWTDYVIVVDWADKEFTEILVFEFQVNSLKLKERLINAPNIEKTNSESLHDYINNKYGNPIYIDNVSESIVKDIRIGNILQKSNQESNENDHNNNENDNLDYIDLGHIDVYYNTEDRWTSELGKYNLYSKQVGSDVFYYICYDHNNEKIYPVTRGSWTFRGNDYNGRANENLYLNISAWYSSSDSGNSGNTEGSSQGGGNIHITHDPQPMQVWKDCMSCGGSTLCQVCGGLGYNGMFPDQECSACRGFKKCTICGGKGGHYEIEYH